MPDLADIVTRVAAMLREVPTAGRVHDRLRSVSVASAADYERLAALVPNVSDRWRGWFLDAWVLGSRRRTTSNGEQLEQGQVEVTIGIAMWWLLPFDDAKGSTVAHRQMSWDAAERLRASPSLDFGLSSVKHGEFQSRRPGHPIALSEAWGSGHVGEADLAVRVITTGGIC